MFLGWGVLQGWTLRGKRLSSPNVLRVPTWPASRAVFPGASVASAGGTRLLADGAADDLSVPEKVLRSRANVFDDLAEQEGGDIASAVHW